LDYGGPDRSLGMLYLEAPPWPISLGNRNKARSHLQAAVALSPGCPENHIALAEAYAKWGEARNLERELSVLHELLPKARAEFKGENWTASWEDWENGCRSSRLQKAT